jgi:outer membrane lipoprotein-sorting protein
LTTLTLTDQLGDVTHVNFSDIRNNVALDDSKFAFKVPAGADIVTAPSASSQ